MRPRRQERYVMGGKVTNFIVELLAIIRIIFFDL